jgi:hypothetical protein
MTDMLWFWEIVHNSVTMGGNIILWGSDHTITEERSKHQTMKHSTTFTGEKRGHIQIQLNPHGIMQKHNRIHRTGSQITSTD